MRAIHQLELIVVLPVLNLLHKSIHVFVSPALRVTVKVSKSDVAGIFCWYGVVRNRSVVGAVVVPLNYS